MNVQQRKVAGIAAAAVLALGGTVLLVAYVRGAESRATKGEKTTSVLVVSEPIAKGTKAEDMSGSVHSELVPAKVKATGALVSLEAVKGLVASVDLVPGEQVVQGRFTTPAAAQESSTAVPPGLQQVTISVSSVRSVSGQVRTGDTVGVVASFDNEGAQTTHFILHKVKVTGVRTGGSVLDTKVTADTPTADLAITLALDAPSVEKVVYAAEYGHIWLSLEPMTANEAGTKVQTRGSVLA